MSKQLEGWEALEKRPQGISEEEKQAAMDADHQWNMQLARTFQTDSGKAVLDRWKRGTLEKRLDLMLTNPMTGQKYPIPQEAIFARIGEENFVKDILTRIERAKQ